MRHLTARPAVWYTLLALACVGQALDLLTTALALHGGDAAEANPELLALLALGGWPLVIGLRVVMTALLAALLAPFAQSRALSRTVWARIALLAVVALLAAVFLTVGHNLALLYILTLPHA